mgnify:FL=1
MASALLWMVAVSNKKFHIVILAAGVGRRLRPLTLNKPKPLVVINGINMLTRLIHDIPCNQVKSMSIVIGYHGKLIEDCVNDMNLPYVVKFYKSPNYNSTHCSASLALVRAILPKGAFLFNSDIVFNTGVLKSIFEFSEEGSFVVCKKPDKDFFSDLQKVKACDGVVQEWSLNLDVYTSEVIGPVYINKLDGGVIKQYIDNNLLLVNKMPCFTFLSKILVNGRTLELLVMQNDCFEIDDIEDLKIASKLLKTSYE